MVRFDEIRILARYTCAKKFLCCELVYIPNHSFSINLNPLIGVKEILNDSYYVDVI